MISFACHCDHPFEVPDDKAGSLIQCPACGRLNDVPLLSDLPNLVEDGTYKLDEPVAAEPGRLDEARKVYSPTRFDQFGAEIDLRGTVSGQPDDGPIDLAYESHDRPSPPKYDPITGELLRPVEVKPESPLDRLRKPLPLSKRPKKRQAIEYLARVQTLELFVMLLRPMNLIVMILIGLLHVFYFATLVVTVFGMIFIIAAWLFSLAIIVSHFVVVIEETGPICQDELPRPMRNVSMYDDIWHPFFSLGLAFLVCFSPALAALLSGLPSSVAIPLAGLLGIVGAFFGPAVLLTTATSGNLMNLRPDRIFGIIRVLGAHYFVMLLALWTGAIVYAMGFLGLHQSLWDMFTAPSMIGPRMFWQSWSLGVPLLLAGIYLLHYVGWLFGQTYRVYQPQFPWIFQGRRGDLESENRPPAPSRGFDVLPIRRAPPSHK